VKTSTQQHRPSLSKAVQRTSSRGSARTLLALVVLVGGATPALAQKVLQPYQPPFSLPPAYPFQPGTVVTDNRTADWSFLNYGSSSFGGSVGADASARRMYVDFPSAPDSPSNYRSAAGLYADAKIFGHTVSDVARFGVTAEDEPYVLSTSGAAAKSGYQANSSAFIKLIGLTVWSESVNSASLSHTWSKNLGPYDTPRFDFPFTLGPVPLIASAWAGASASVSFTAAANVASVSLTLAGHAEGNVHGIAQLGLGGSFASIGLAGELRFGNPVIDASLGAGIFSGITGTLDACMTPVKFLLDVYAEIRVWKVLKRWSKNIASWSGTQVCVHRTL